MSKSSNVGSSGVYGDDDQRNYKDSELRETDRFHEGKPNSHLANDSKDERSIANKLAREEKREKESDPVDEESEQAKKDPTLPAISHGNKPSRGAQIDKEIQEEEEEILKKKGAFGPKN